MVQIKGGPVLPRQLPPGTPAHRSHTETKEQTPRSVSTREEPDAENSS